MNALRLLALAALLAVTASLQAAPDRIPASGTPGGYLKRTEVREFITQMEERHGFVRRELETLFRKAAFQPDIVRAITPPAQASVRSWQNYRAMFVNPQRIEAGLKFRERNAASLQRAADQFGVPAEIILAIIGVETVYGRNMGRYRVIDALSTLAFDYPRRADFFRSELEQFLLFTREAGIDVLGVRGSYAGAIGIPQFMPGSYRRFAIDFDGDGQANIIDSAADAIGSVANFLKGHGWEPGQPAAFPASVDGNAWRKLADAGVKPTWRIAELHAHGITMADNPPLWATMTPETLASVIELETPSQSAKVWVGLNNFYVITRYNRSSFYAIAILELASALRETNLPLTGRSP